MDPWTRNETGYILVIEDDLDIQELLEAVLTGEGWPMVGATDGQTGLDRAKEREPSLVILDMNLPVVHGDAVAIELHRLYNGIPILVMTANGQAKDNAMNARAFGYLKKPFDVDALIVAIHAGSRHGRTIEHRQFLERA